jgi:lysophospholipase L1-like esterase
MTPHSPPHRLRRSAPFVRNPLPLSRVTPSRAVALLAVAAGALFLAGCAPSRLANVSELARNAEAYTARPTQPDKRVLIVGDSTAVGTGADTPAQSLAGLIGQQHPRWQIDNLGSNGAKFSDVPEQLQRASDGYDLVLVLAGGNDVIRFTPLFRLREPLHKTVALAAQKGRHVVLMPCGNVGHAPFFAPPLTWAFSRRSERLHGLVQEVAASEGATYVRLLRPRDQDPFVIHSDTLHATDGLHPSSAGYAEWYRELVAQGGLAPLLAPVAASR